jgi:MFS family permease
VVLFLLNMVDELDQITFGAVAPNIRDTFELSEQSVTTIAAIAASLVIALIVPIGVWADRHDRVRMSALAALAWGSMTVLTGVAGYLSALPLLFVSRLGAGLGRVMNEPVHASLLADYYEPVHHGKVFSLHRMASPIGLMLVLPCSALADVVGWRLCFILLAVPTLVIVLFVSRLEEPDRGASIMASLGAGRPPPGERVPWRDAYRLLKQIPSLRRMWLSLFFLGAAIIPIATFFAFFFENVYDVESITARGAILTVYGLGALIGLELGSRRSTASLMAGDLPKLANQGAATLLAAGAGLFATAVAPWLALSIVSFFAVGVAGSAYVSYYLPLVAAVGPPRMRSQAFAWGGLWFAAGAIVVTPIVSGIGEEVSYRVAIPILAVLVGVAARVFRTVAPTVRADAAAAYAAVIDGEHDDSGGAD